MSTPTRLALITAGLGAGYLGWVSGPRAVATSRWQREHARPQSQSGFASTYGGDSVKILQFYAEEGSVVEGGRTLICYGVVNAKSVRIEPAIAQLAPSLNRCVPATLERQTRYTLTAEGNDGRTVSEEF